jgi:hypothetical protein
MSKRRKNILEQQSAGIQSSTIVFERTGRYDRDGDWSSVFKRKMHRFVDDFAGVERRRKGGVLMVVLVCYHMRDSEWVLS